MRYLFSIFLFIFSIQLSAQSFSKLKVWLDPVTETLLMERGVELDHGVIKKGVFLINDFDKQTIDWMNQSGIRYEVLIEDVQDYYTNRTEIESRGGRASCADVQVDTFAVPDNFSLGSMGGFYTYEEFLEQVDSMHALFPNLITQRAPIDTFQSHENRPIYWLKISDNPTIAESEPEVLYTSIHHAREPQSLTQLIFYMWYLLENYGQDDEVTALVDDTEMYFVPMLNPDGYIRNQTTNPNGGGMWRKNRRDNGDGTFGVDLNRNYGYNWGVNNQGSSPNTSSDTYRGPSAFSEPETRAISWLCEQHQFGLALNYHSYGNYLIYPWGYGSVLTPDSNTFIAFADAMTAQNNYTYGTGMETVGYGVNGDSDDWMYGEQNTKNKIFSMTPEVGAGDDGFWPLSSHITPLSQENVFPNLLLAHYVGDYATITDDSPTFLSQINGDIEAIAVRLGLQFNGPYTFSLEAVSSNIASTGAAVNLSSMSLVEEETLSLGYSLNTGIAAGEAVVFDLVATFNGKEFRQRIEKSFGAPVVAIGNSGQMGNEFLSATNWDETTIDFFSPSTSITDSPFGSYSSSSSNELDYNRIIDLRHAIQGYLKFHAKWVIEPGWDYAQILASPVLEDNWTPLCGQYTVEGNSFQDEGQPIWDGGQNTWVEEYIDLSDFVGERIKIKFKLESDLFVEYDGMYIDDLQYLTVQDPAWEGGIDTGYVDTIGTTIDPDPDSNLSIAQQALHAVEFYPNPASDYVVVKSRDQKKVDVVIYNLLGRRVMELQDFAGRIDLSGLDAGTYLVELNRNGLRRIERLVVSP